MEHPHFLFRPELWRPYLQATCYTYALNLFTNARQYVGELALGERVSTSVSDQELLLQLYRELKQVGLSPCMVREDTPLSLYRRRVCLIRESGGKGYYHFYRQDAFGLWSHKAPDAMPIQTGRTGCLIYHVASEMEEGYRVLAYMAVDALPDLDI